MQRYRYENNSKNNLQKYWHTFDRLTITNRWCFARFSISIIIEIWDVFRDLVPSVQFKKRELLLVKVTLLMVVFQVF